MAQDLKGQVAAVTGAASGIGFECAKHMVEAGMTVFLVDRDEKALKEKCAELGEKAKPLVIDLLSPESVATMVPQILEQAGQLDVFHANAGAYIGGPLWEGNPDAWDRM
jgi:ribitol 2-dehydrogenase